MSQTKILIIEDQSKIASFLKQGLEENGYYTQVIHDNNTDVIKAIKNAFDLVILDLNISFVNGHSMSRKIKEASLVPVLMLTSQTVNTFENAIDRLVIPFPFDDLLKKVNILLNKVGNMC